MNNVDNTETINVLSLCTGYGGLELGLSLALEGVLRVVAVEVEAYAMANLAAKAQEGKLAIEAMWPDLKTFPAERFRGCFDYLLAGYPCQSFSVAGKRLGTKDPRWVWPHIARIIEAVEPVWCIFENVPGHLSIGLPEVYCSLRNMGYSVEAGLFTAAEVGAPHKRQRLFIMAHRGRHKRCSQLANTGGRPGGNQERQAGGRARQADVPQGNGTAGTVRIRAAGQLADTAQQLCNGSRTARTGRRNEYPDCRWPSRPGQPQYEWEEPRVIMSRADSTFLKGYVEKYQARLTEGQIESLAYAVDSYAIESPMGKSTHGITNNVDQLRLLGNGVSPKQAEKAIRELGSIINNKS